MELSIYDPRQEQNFFREHPEFSSLGKECLVISLSGKGWFGQNDFLINVMDRYKAGMLCLHIDCLVGKKRLKLKEEIASYLGQQSLIALNYFQLFEDSSQASRRLVECVENFADYQEFIIAGFDPKCSMLMKSLTFDESDFAIKTFWSNHSNLNYILAFNCDGACWELYFRKSECFDDLLSQVRNHFPNEFRAGDP